ncbi:AbrB/MazE/SpoVT family DNA-binding domain-containing protein [Alicyclobacillus sp. SP_1]|jgi:transcriptional pleiotropic regulator of transition state genes|uniref:AbrB/MazE/SpoVT family DNA-binding domain-containing protein n=1 Tax=Alicyclobacillus sp. SP_1 TaxID=2942475 RepID=UPI002158222E|nr:AbrB/MazE/SpoVT family DNA-binding domain-containing protein [Alicyclobacillus sp. SP_1]
MVLSTGMSRKLDSLGRLVLPIELRRTLQIENGDSIEFFTDQDHLVLRRYTVGCLFCETYHLDTEGARWYKGAYLCPHCREALKALAEAHPSSAKA